MDGVEGEVGKDGAVVGDGREDACLCVVWMVGEEKVEEVVVASGSADGFSEVEVLAYFVEAAAEWSCGGVGEAEPLSVVDVEVAEEKMPMWWGVWWESSVSRVSRLSRVSV